MNKENTQYLRENFPNLYKDIGGDPRLTCMAWGFECKDGWFEIIKELSEKLEPFGVTALQVKEKFGGLSFYINTCPEENSDEIYKYIHEAESKSYETCEICGKPGKCLGVGWMRTLCNDCRKND